MSALLQKIAMLLWPFFLEVFVKNPDVRKTLKKNKLLIIVIFVGSFAALTYLKTSGSNHEANVRYQDMTQSFMDLETRYRDLWDRRNELRGRLNDVYAQLDQMEARVRDTMRTNRELREENEDLNVSLESARQGGESAAICPEPGSPIRRSRVMEYLEDLGA